VKLSRTRCVLGCRSEVGNDGVLLPKVTFAYVLVGVFLSGVWDPIHVAEGFQKAVRTAGRDQFYIG
jgi:hypothetical protein